MQSQLRLGSFFKKPEPTPASPTSADNSRRNSIDFGTAQDLVASVSTSVSPIKASATRASDYEKSFPPFFLQTNTSLAPSNRFSKDEDALNFARARMDSHLKDTAHSLSGHSSFNPYHLFQIVPHRRGIDRGVSSSVKDILSRMQGSSNAPIDLTDSGISQNLKSIPMKVLHFREDVRPPYQGTFTKLISPRSAMKIARNPFHRALPDTDYDYDSEAEWEEPEEGEDLDSEVEDDTSEPGDEDMEDFLDDEDDLIKGKRRAIVGDLEPCSSGLCWEDPSQGWKTENLNLDLSSYRLEVMLGERPRHSRYSFPEANDSLRFGQDPDQSILYRILAVCTIYPILFEAHRSKTDILNEPTESPPSFDQQNQRHYQCNPSPFNLRIRTIYQARFREHPDCPTTAVESSFQTEAHLSGQHASAVQASG
jgi:hypothetical protein